MSKILRESLTVTLVCAVILILLQCFRDGGVLHFESAIFLVNYCDGRTLIEQIFDPARTDWNLYQARELSCLFDALDARIVRGLINRGCIWFYSVFSGIFLLLTIFLQQYYGRKLFPRLSGTMLTLLSLSFILAPGAAGIPFFRTAKFLTAMGITLAMGSGYEIVRHPEKRSSKVLFVIALTIMVLADRQGFFFASAFTGCTGVLLLLWNKKNLHHTSCGLNFMIKGGLTVVIFGIFNNLYLTPAIIEAVNGYTPDFSYQRGVAASPEVVTNGMIFVFGNIGNWLHSAQTAEWACAGGILLFGTILFCLRRSRYILLPLWGLLGIAMVLCSGLMAVRHGAIMDSRIMFGTYFVTFMAIFVMLLIPAAAKLSAQGLQILILFLLCSIGLRIGTQLAGEKFDHDDGMDLGFRRCRYELKECLLHPEREIRDKIIPCRMRYLIEFLRSQKR